MKLAQIFIGVMGFIVGYGSCYELGTCYSNMSKCEYDYNNYLLKKMDIGKVSFDRLIRMVSTYNYNMNYISKIGSSRNKRDRRNIRYEFSLSKNIKQFSSSKELEMLNHICDINYKKLDSKSIKKLEFKYKKMKHIRYDSSVKVVVFEIYKIIIIMMIIWLLVIIK